MNFIFNDFVFQGENGTDLFFYSDCNRAKVDKKPNIVLVGHLSKFSLVHDLKNYKIKI